MSNLAASEPTTQSILDLVPSGSDAEQAPNTSESSFNFSRINIATLPPMLKQYVDFKNRHPECVICFQVGDFYEIFFDDAILVSKSLNLTLTSRDKSSDAPIPMCGVPVSSLDGYVERLVEIGMSVAVVSQVNASSFSRLPTAYKEENNQGKITISRELTRIVTPGIRLLGETNSALKQSFVMALCFGDKERASISYSDPQSGTIFVRASLVLSDLCDEVCRVAPTELILPRSLDGSRLDGRSSLVRKLQRAYAGLIIKYRDVRNLRPAGTTSRSLVEIEGYQALEVEAKQAVALLLDYVDETTISAQIAFSKIINDESDDTMVIGATTRANLELLTSATAGPQAGLLFAIDKTKTAGGARKLKSWLLRPLKKVDRIIDRYNVVDFFKSDSALRNNIRKKLELSPDLERIAARLELQCISPRELGALRDIAQALHNDSIIAVETVLNLPEVSSGKLDLLQNIIKKLTLPTELRELLCSALRDELPPQLADGFVIRPGYNAELDVLRSYQQEGRDWVLDFEKREQARSGISTLKVKFNYVLGFFIEVTKSQVSKVPSDYEKRQGTTSAERFVTPELKERERGVLGADEKALALERKLYLELRNKLLLYSPQIRICAEALAELDVLSSFAELADSESYVRPEIDNSTELNIKKGRHPVVEMLIGSGFVPNSLKLGGDKSQTPSALILTGPNMGGKSTYLRQAGVLSIMAQIGSFVPAESFKLGLVDQIFARIGASDNIAGGESTFMVEMREVVQIISASTERSLILIDEVGRGTATADGAALAQAIIEWLVKERRCRILFATHFHNLTELPINNHELANICVAAVESDGEIIFTHQIKDGAAGHSYGLEVAKLAGVPFDIIKRSAELVAKNVLIHNEIKNQNAARAAAQMALPINLPLKSSDKKVNELVEDLARHRAAIFNPTENELERFDVANLDVADLLQQIREGGLVLPEDYEQLVAIKKELSDLNVNAMTPLEALNFLSQLRSKLGTC